MQIRYLLALSLLPHFVMADESEANIATRDLSAGSQCIISPPIAPRLTDELSTAPNTQISITADRTQAQMGKEARFEGGVTFTQGPRFIAADEAVLDQQNQQLNANGNLVFQDSLFTVTADSLNAQMTKNSATLKGAKYWLHGQQVHGAAEKLEITQDNQLLLTKTNFTTCPPDDVSWLLEADRIKIDGDEEWGEIWNARLKVADTTVLFIPYMTVPVSDKRKTGFLFPYFNTSTTNGIELATPYYWNIAPEYDATFTPNYMSSRGLFLKSEFRYLTGEAQIGQMNVEYLDRDQLLRSNPDRYSYHWQHQGALDENWRVLANFTEVSDNNYFNDLKSEISRATDNQLSRVGDLSYFEKDWNVGLKVQDIKVLGQQEKPYQVMPQLTMNYRAPDIFGPLEFSLYSEVTNFEHKDNEFNTATRAHIAPSLALPFQGPAGSFLAEAKLMQTNYWQQDDNLGQGTLLDEDVNRTIPQLRLLGQINFERDTHIFSQDYRQTLEPQFQYLYVGYEDQSGVGLYDTAPLQDDYFGLFRERRFSGLDRIADTNQLTLGMTTRLFDGHNLEQFKFSLGQIIYFEDSEVRLLENPSRRSSSTSVLAAELDAHLYQDWYLSGALQFDTKASDTKKSELTLDFKPQGNKLLQLSYRHVPDLLNANTNDRVNISQAGARGTWPLSHDISFVGSWYYDLNETRNVEAYTGFQYESCCWAVRLSYHYHIKTNYLDDINPSLENRELFESGFALNFVIKGLGGSGPLGILDMLEDSLFNYRKPLYLRN
jgi:LPS-assembly protein